MLPNEQHFKEIIGENKFEPKKLDQISDETEKRLFIHYLTKTGLIKVFIDCDKENRDFVRNYFCNEFPVMYKRMIEHIFNSHVQKSLINALLVEFREKLVADIFDKLDFSAEQHYLVDALKKAQAEMIINIFDCELVKCFYLYRSTGFLTKKDINEIEFLIRKLDERGTREYLLKKFPKFKKTVIDNLSEDQAGAEYIVEQVEKQLEEVYKQISLFDL